MIRDYFLLILILACFIFQVNAQEKDAALKGKKQGHIPKGLKNGICQSPINIISKRTENGQHTVLFDFEAEIDQVENLGHTVQLDVAPGNTVTHAGEVYNFKQIHFHTHSEHQVDGIIYPMEMHIVHAHEDTKEKQNHYLVIGLLFKMGDQSEFIDEFINQIPSKEHSKKLVAKGTIRLHDMIKELPKEEVQDFYHYLGSLTTPPFTETVNWYVGKHIYEASPEQIEKIKEIEGENARKVQKLNARKVEN